MSILDAYRNQRSEQKSIRQLAQLPQQLIIQMAQRGDIPAEVAPVVINEKARMAKEMANIQAMMAQQAQGQAPTVLEQAMSANAQAENPQPPQGAQTALAGVVPTPETAAAGVTGLPLGANMFNQKNFAGGGIVAFQPGGNVSLSEIVDKQLREDPSYAGMFSAGMSAPAAAEEPQAFRRRYTSLADALRDVQSVTSGPRTESPEEIAFREYQKQYKPRSEAEMRQQGWMRALEAGLGIMGGTSPYALTNIGKGAESALKGYGEDVKEQRRREAAFLQSAAQQARQKRLEGIEDVKEARQLLEKDIEAEYRERALTKDTDLRDSTKLFFNEMVAKGADPNDPRTMAEARRKAYEYTGLAAQRVGTQQFGIESQNRREANNYVESRLNKQANPEALKMRRLEQEDKKNGTDTASAYRDSLFSEAYGRISRGETLSGPLGGGAKPEAKTEGAAKTQGGKPDLSKVSGIPSGSKVGNKTAQGWEVLDSRGTLIGHIKE